MLRLIAFIFSLLQICATNMYIKMVSPEIQIHDLLPIEIEEKWGYVDEHGDIIIQPQWKEAGAFSTFVARVSLISDLGSAVREFHYMDGLIDRNGNYILEPNYSIIETDYLYYIAQENHGDVLFGYFDKESGFSQSPRYEKILDSFPYYMNYDRDKRIAVKQNGKWGFIYRETGEVALPFIYDDILFTFNNGYALVVQNANTKAEKWLLIDTNGIPLKIEEDSCPVSGITNSGAYIIEKTVKHDQKKDNYEVFYGLANIFGKQIIVPCYTYMQWENGTTASFCSKEGLWGLIDENGVILIDAQYSSEYDLPIEIK